MVASAVWGYENCPPLNIYVQRGISRYNADWGPSYRALSGSETGLLLQAGSVRQLFGVAELEAGVPLRGTYGDSKRLALWTCVFCMCVYKGFAAWLPILVL